MSEPIIIINGQRLIDAQAMTIRVALNNFSIDLDNKVEPVLGDDELGKSMTKGYQKRISEINEIILG